MSYLVLIVRDSREFLLQFTFSPYPLYTNAKVFHDLGLFSLGIRRNNKEEKEKNGGQDDEVAALAASDFEEV